MKIRYEPARTILLVSAVFCLFGTLPRMLGIVVTKPEHAGWVPYMDATAVIVFGAALVWSFFAIVRNARMQS